MDDYEVVSHLGKEGKYNFLLILSQFAVHFSADETQDLLRPYGLMLKMVVLVVTVQ
jgi:hypothetical protein